MIGRFCSTLLTLILITAVWPSLSPALTIDSEQQFQFAEELFTHRQYRRAGEEYQRFVFFFPEDPRGRQANFKAGQAFLMAKDPALALDLFKALTNRDELDPIAVEAYFMMVECHLEMNSITHAVLELNNLLVLSNSIEVRDRAHYRLGWLYIDQTDWTAARKSFAKISAPQRDRYRVDELERELAQTDRLPSRDPTLAGILSIIPGAGQLYCHRYEDALIAFAVNIGLFWAAHDAFDQEQYALGGLLSFVGLGFYAGNIYSAVSDAHKFNQMQKQQFGDSLRKSVALGIRPLPPKSSDGVLFSLHLAF